MSLKLLDEVQPDSAQAVRPQRPPVHYSVGRSLLLFLVDATMFVLSSYLAIAVANHTLHLDNFVGRFFHSASIFVVIWIITFERVGLYKRTFGVSGRDEFYSTVVALGLGVVPQLILFTLVPSLSTSRLVTVLSLLFAIIFVGGSRSLLRLTLAAVGRVNPRRIAIVGRPDRVRAVASSLNITKGTRVLRLDVDNVDDTLASLNGWGPSPFDRVDWLNEAIDWGCQTLILTEVLPASLMPSFLTATSRARVKVAFAPPRLECHAYVYRLQLDGRQALIIPQPLPACTMAAQILKRTFDLTAACFALVVLSPVMLSIALAILLESGRPILYRQERVGLHGRTFEMLKFRSMKNNAEESTGPVWATMQDNRRTKVGAIIRKLSLDELPQFFNVVVGDMSVVGPRPERPVFVEEFRTWLPRYDERHLVRPGITGWAQVHMRRDAAMSEVGQKLNYDLYYLEHWTPFVDLLVAFKTAAEVLTHKAL